MGLNVHNGQITYKAVAQAHGMASVEMDFLP
jgi:alanine dehydrogenase